jgi:hypothetical protein
VEFDDAVNAVILAFSDEQARLRAFADQLGDLMSDYLPVRNWPPRPRYPATCPATIMPRYNGRPAGQARAPVMVRRVARRPGRNLIRDRRRGRLPLIKHG